MQESMDLLKKSGWAAPVQIAPQVLATWIPQEGSWDARK